MSEPNLAPLRDLSSAEIDHVAGGNPALGCALLAATAVVAFGVGLAAGAVSAGVIQYAASSSNDATQGDGDGTNGGESSGDDAGSSNNGDGGRTNP